MKRLISVLLCLCLLCGLCAGCGAADADVYVPTGNGLTYEEEDAVGPVTATESEEASTQELSLAYYPEQALNPFKSTDYTNRVLISLMYQGLFITDRDYNVQPVLCSRYTMSKDMTTYTFYIDEKATFSNGTKLRPEDVLASLQAARNSSMYGSRFSKVNRLYLAEDGGIVITMNTAYENLPLLLDVPIIMESQLQFATPLGTGPYRLYSTRSGMKLKRLDDWWCTSDLIITAPLISLVEAESVKQIRDEFQFGELDLVQADPGSDKYADFRCDFELWDSENGMFLYLGVHEDSSVFSNGSVRKALTHAINRDYIASEFYRGFARPATLPASPLSPYYNQKLASKYAYSEGVFEKAVEEAGYVGREVILIANEDDSLRLRVAKYIAETLNQAGLVVKVIPYSGSSYSYILRTGEYDLYLGQTKLSPNMDLSHFFSTSGNLNAGGMDDVTCYALAQQALENHGNYYSLHQTVMDNGFLCPILFRSYAVYATRGLLTGLTPARDQVFYYSIGKTMTEAYFESE